VVENGKLDEPRRRTRRTEKLKLWKMRRRVGFADHGTEKCRNHDVPLLIIYEVELFVKPLIRILELVRS